MSQNVAKSVLDRSKPPKPGPLPKVFFPKFETRKLSNGLPVYVVENHDQPILTAALYVRAGSMFDPPGREGLAATVGDMLTKGTTTRSALQIADEIDFIGGALYASASWDAMVLGVTVLSKHKDIGLNLLADITLNSTFPEEDQERVKLQRLAGLKHAKADAGFLADMVFSKLLYPDHPYGQQASGTEASIEEIRRADLTHFYRHHFGPNNAFLVAAGDVDSDSFVEQLEGLFAGWPTSLGKEEVVPAPKIARGRQVGLIHKEGAVQSALRVGHIGVPRNTDDYIALSAMNMILGGYFNSRVNLNLREKHGFTYGARSYFDTRLEAGPFVVSTEVRTEVTIRALEEIISEITRISKELITEEELSMVKNYMIGNFPLQIETPQQVANRIATLVLYDLPLDYYDTYRTMLAALSRDELYRVAAQYLHPDSLTVVASGNIQALESALNELGTLQIFDHSGKLVDSIASI